MGYMIIFISLIGCFICLFGFFDCLLGLLGLFGCLLGVNIIIISVCNCCNNLNTINDLPPPVANSIYTDSFIFNSCNEFCIICC